MQWMLKPGQKLVARGMQSAVTVEGILGEGAQAEVFCATVGSSQFALKWYRPEYLPNDARLWERLSVAIQNGSPTEQFLWPFDVVSVSRSGSYGGYLMPIKPPEFISLVDLIRRKAEPSFRVLCGVGFRLAHSFLKLHAAGLCYRDINFGNVFFDPASGDIRIADTDNVDVNLKPGAIKGTPGFMAPEVGRDEVLPNAASDRFSLAVLLFYIFMLGHPLKGQLESALPYDAADPDGSHRLCVKNPLFVFDPGNATNRPDPDVHNNVLAFWPIYPESLRKLFTRAFTFGLFDFDARVMENEWRKEMRLLADMIFVCPNCSAENFFDIERARNKSHLNPCWGCGGSLAYPPRMRIGDAYDASVVVLSEGVELFPHHLERDTYNFMRPLARVVSPPLGLLNLSPEAWTSSTLGGELIETRPHERLALASARRIQFGKWEGEVKV
jgi:DNA-binding helix-hairpin-helix protein with protein kinase domain